MHSLAGRGFSSHDYKQMPNKKIKAASAACLAAVLALVAGNAAAHASVDQFVSLYGEASRNNDQATLNTFQAYIGGAVEGLALAHVSGGPKLFCAPPDLTYGTAAQLLAQASNLSEAHRKQQPATVALLLALQARYPCKD